jgi:hypothetical protein
MNKVPAALPVWREDWIIIYVVDLLLMRGGLVTSAGGRGQKLKMRTGGRERLHDPESSPFHSTS